MKRFLKGALVIFICFFIIVYFLIPNVIKVGATLLVPQPSGAISRALTSTQDWGQWVPSHTMNNQIIELENGNLRLKQSLLSSVDADYVFEAHTIPVTFFTTAKEKDTSYIAFEAFIDNRHVSPFDRIAAYYRSRKVKSQMSKLLTAAGNYYSKTESIYGCSILHERVKDSVLISTNYTYPDTPSMEAQYALIHQLEQHIQKNNGIIHGDPMVNITKIGEGAVFTQVAFPLAKSIPTTAGIQIKKMVLGNILTVHVTGNALKVKKAFQETENYIHDRSISSPAIPFIVYNKNRLLEKDANKWVSTIYYPVY